MKNLRLRKARLRKGITQAKLAGKIGYTQAYISKIESGSIKPNPYIRARIAKALGTKVSEIFPKIKRARR
jgi:transcriptional regulator with XRE-family HTH domain